jgi:hypothetical protein
MQEQGAVAIRARVGYVSDTPSQPRGTTVTTKPPRTVIDPDLPTDGWVIATMTNGDPFVLAPTEEAALGITPI